jgi:site-specific recombinase XerD
MKNTLKELFDEYINQCQYTTRLRPETIKSYKAVFKHFAATMPEVNTAQLLTVERMNEFFKRIQERERVVGRNTKQKGLKISTIHTYGSKLRAFFEWLIGKKLLEENPIKKIKLPRPEYTDQRFLRKNEIEKIIAAIITHPLNPLTLKRDTAMLYVLLFCGLRAGEFISLQVRDIDMTRQKLTVRAETSKSKKLRVLPIHPLLLLHMQEYINERKKRNYKTEYLWVSSNGDTGLTRHGLKHWVEKLKKQSGVEFHLHRFRHTFACNLANGGASFPKIQKLLGHTDPKMTFRYLRSITSEECGDDIAKLSLENLM